MRRWNAGQRPSAAVHWHKVLLLPQLALALASLISSAEAARGGLPDNFDKGSLLQTRLSVESQLEQTGSDFPDFREKYIQKLANYADLQYVASYQCGGQSISGILDTGSFDLLVFPNKCITCGSAGKYHPDQSSTHELGIYSMSQTYGSGRAMAFEAFEKVSLGPFVSPHQIFWEVQEANMPVLETASFSSIIGLGPPETSAVDAWLGAEASVQEIIRDLNTSEEVLVSSSHRADMDITAAISMTRKPALVRSFGVDTFSLCLGEKTGSDGLIVWNDDAADLLPAIFHELSLVGEHTWSVSLMEPHFSAEAAYGLLQDLVARTLLEKNVSAIPFLTDLDRVREAYQLLDSPGIKTSHHHFGDADAGVANITDAMMNVLKPLDLLPSVMSGLIDAFSPLGCIDGCGALLDSGTSLLVLPAKMIYRIQSAMQALGANCSDLAKLPDLVFTLGNVTLSIPPDAYITQAPPGIIPEHLEGLVRSRTIHGGTDQAASSSCRLMVMESTATTQHGDLFILGMPFFRKYYTSFTYGESLASRRVRVARAGDGCHPVAETPSMNQIVNRTVPYRSLDFAKMYVPRSVQAARSQRYVRI